MCCISKPSVFAIINGVQRFYYTRISAQYTIVFTLQHLYALTYTLQSAARYFFSTVPVHIIV